MEAQGVDALQAVELASNKAFAGILSTLSDQLLPNAAQVFDLIRSLGISSAEDIQKAFEGISGLGSQFPGGTPSQFVVGDKSGKLIYGHVDAASGQFVPDAAPPLTGPQQKTTRKDPSTPRVQGLDSGGIVTGPTGSPQLILAHGGETVI